MDNPAMYFFVYQTNQARYIFGYKTMDNLARNIFGISNKIFNWISNHG